MALTIKEMLDQTREKYHLKLLSGETALDYIVTWVHMTTDTSVAEFFWGNEVIVTSGYLVKDEADLIRFLDVMMEHRCAGVVLNVGKYISEVPQSVIQHCKEREFPLITMPWHMSQTEFVRDCCSRIYKSSREDDHLAEAVIHTLRAPYESGIYQAHLSEYFQEKQGFQMLAVHIQVTEDIRANVLDQRSILRLHTALRSFSFPYLVFRYQKRFIVLLNSMDRKAADMAAQRVLECIRERLVDTFVCVGVGEPVTDYIHLSDSFHEAVAAGRRAFFQKIEMVRFRDMGFYKLLYAAPDREFLTTYYQETMGPLLEHDQKYGSVYTETLFHYLKAEGSLQQVADEMFTHRNTVNYRMGKIREILGCNLANQEEKMPYLMAYYVGQVLGETK
ncbi:MAG: PucR family transcriptional regulator ligand-binding domain-containing protein [Oscillospiraceae bacterium]|nr:PucR family transcriptional regulator ligand-binding domain-containing protein [Oscillospiraceae bacterium]